MIRQLYVLFSSWPQVPSHLRLVTHNFWAYKIGHRWHDNTVLDGYHHTVQLTNKSVQFPKQSCYSFVTISDKHCMIFLPNWYIKVTITNAPCSTQLLLPHNSTQHTGLQRNSDFPHKDYHLVAGERGDEILQYTSTLIFLCTYLLLVRSSSLPSLRIRRRSLQQTFLNLCLWRHELQNWLCQE